jgi:hypothetical protein
MRSEIEQRLRKADLGKYIIEAAKADDSIEKGFQEGMMQESEKQLAIDRVGSEQALDESELLTNALFKENRNVR